MDSLLKGIQCNRRNLRAISVLNWSLHFMRDLIPKYAKGAHL